MDMSGPPPPGDGQNGENQPSSSGDTDDTSYNLQSMADALADPDGSSSYWEALYQQTDYQAPLELGGDSTYESVDVEADLSTEQSATNGADETLEESPEYEVKEETLEEDIQWLTIQPPASTPNYTPAAEAQQVNELQTINVEANMRAGATKETKQDQHEAKARKSRQPKKQQTPSRQPRSSSPEPLFDRDASVDMFVDSLMPTYRLPWQYNPIFEYVDNHVTEGDFRNRILARINSRQITAMQNEGLHELVDRIRSLESEVRHAITRHQLRQNMNLVAAIRDYRRGFIQLPTNGAIYVYYNGQSFGRYAREHVYPALAPLMSFTEGIVFLEEGNQTRLNSSLETYRQEYLQYQATLRNEGANRAPELYTNDLYAPAILSHAPQHMNGFVPQMPGLMPPLNAMGYDQPVHRATQTTFSVPNIAAGPAYPVFFSHQFQPNGDPHHVFWTPELAHQFPVAQGLPQQTSQTRGFGSRAAPEMARQQMSPVPDIAHQTVAGGISTESLQVSFPAAPFTGPPIHAPERVRRRVALFRPLQKTGKGEARPRVAFERTEYLYLKRKGKDEDGDEDGDEEEEAAEKS